MTITLIVLAITIVMMIIGRIRADIVALCALATLMCCGILTPAEAFAGFSSTVVIMMVGLFVVGGAIFQTGLAKAASRKIMHLAGNNDMKQYLLVVLSTAAIGAFVSNTGTVALMMPIVVSMAAQSGTSPARLLMPLAFASSLGGMLTLIGTPPNLVISDTLAGEGYEPLGFFSFTPVGIAVILIGLVAMYPLIRMFIYKKSNTEQNDTKKGKSLEQLVKEYHLENGLRRYRITSNSTIKEKSVAELDLRSKFGLSILEIRNERKDRSGLIRNITQSLATPDRILVAGDILYLLGDTANIEAFATKTHLEQMDKGNIDFYDIGIAEIVLMPNSRLNDTKLKNSGFREQYSINILGIKRDERYILDNLPNEKLKAGDILLIQGSWNNIAKLEHEDEWVVLGQPEEKAGQVTLNYRAPLAAAIMVLMIAAMVFDFIPIQPVTAVIIAGLLMVLGGCFRNVEAAYKTINWESIVLIAAMMPMSTALEKTGTSALVSHSLVELLGGVSPIVLLAGIYFTTSMLSMVISNTATAVLMAPIAMTAAMEVGLNPHPFLFAVTLGASMCFASPFATPPNALVMRAGGYTFGDYVKVGLPLQIIIGVIMTFVLPLLFPF